MSCTPVFAATEVAITVDDLPTHGQLPPGVSREDIARKMTAVLKKHSVPDPYAFINAGKVDVLGESAGTLKIWQEAGFPFGNHTYLHTGLNKQTAAEFSKEIEQNEPMLRRLSGEKDWHYFRYPFLREGETLEKRNAVRKYLADHGYKIAQVTIDFEDWSWNDPYARCKEKGDEKAMSWLEKTYLQNATEHLERARILQKGLFKREIPHVLLLHIGAFDAEMLDKLLTAYEKNGVKFVSLVQAEKDEVYAVDPGIAAKWGSELTYQILNARGKKLKDVGLMKYDGYPAAQLEKICL